jgi:hypothetical protein
MAVTAVIAKAVRDREHGRCQLCLLGEYEVGPEPQWRLVFHHIAPRGLGGVGDKLLREEADEPSELALLHDQCHRWLHDNPRQARALGLIRSRLGMVSPSALISGRQPA